MKKRKKLLPWVSVAVCCCAFAVYFFVTRSDVDRVAPEITVPKGTLEVSAEAGERELLKGVTARDDRDGDVTRMMVVESVSDVYDDNRATVTYAAFDEAGNVSKASRPIRYQNYEGPRLTLSGPLLFYEGARTSIFDLVGARDSRDGSLDDQVKATLVDGGTMMEQAGDYQVEFRVTNSLGDTERLVLPVEIVAADAAEQMPHLTEYLVYLRKGQTFDPGQYLAPDTKSWPLKVSTELDTKVPGIYTVDYTDIDGAQFGRTQLIVVVEE